jgi:hypothetical protein
MSKYSILKPEQSYTFSQYFLLPNPIIDILIEFDYSYDRTELELPRYLAAELAPNLYKWCVTDFILTHPTVPNFVQKSNRNPILSD